MDTQSNISPELWAEAMADYTADKAAEDRARGITRRHQLAYESQGIPPKEVRRRYAESQLSPEERQQVYITEQVSRRALGLWDADSPEEFERALERAAGTPLATGEGSAKLIDVNCYNDGFNSARHGGGVQDDNPHHAGSREHVQWARGCADGIDYNVHLEGGSSARQAPAMEEAPANEAPKRGRGRPRKQAAAVANGHDASPSSADPAPTTPGAGLFDDAPAMPRMPE